MRHSSNFINLTGRTFGKWTVKTCVRHKGGHMQWLCVCECGNKQTLDGCSLTRGHSKRCRGCKNKAQCVGVPARIKRTRPQRRYTQAKHTARCNGLLFTLTRPEYENLILQPCIYGGQPLPVSGGSSLDQKIAGGGYTLENSLPCCMCHNSMKGALLSYKHMQELMRLFPELRKCSNSIRRLCIVAPTGGLFDPGIACSEVDSPSTYLR